MTQSLEQSPPGGLGRLVLVAAVFSLFVPAPVFAFPLAALLIGSRLESRSERILAVVAGAISVAWLLLPGERPDQVIRTALVLSTVTFATLTRFSQLSFTHRALAALAVATAGIIVFFVVFGWSWDELHWWVLSQRSYESRLALGPIRAAAAAQGATVDNLESVLMRSVAFEADNFAAVTALKLLAGLALASALYQRVARHPAGTALGRFRDFRFSEHLGWGAVIPLLIVLLPGLLRAKVAASNLLLLTGTLYALRGLAVAAFVAGLAGTGPVATVLGVVAGLLMLPVVVGGGILLGVLDAGMDLRSRWSKPPARN
jgi:hypothetical protein